jgi:hypothetical protein
MFNYMGITTDNEAIFIDFKKNDFNFLVKIVGNANDTFSISYWCRAHKCNSVALAFNSETLQAIIPQNRHAEALSFFHEVQSYACATNSEFMSQIEEYKRDLMARAAPPRPTQDRANEDDARSTYRP